MAEIPANLRLLTATITVGTDSYTEHIQDYSFDPTNATSEITDVGGKPRKFAGESGWALTLNVFQDFTSTGFARKCLDQEGTAVPITIVDGPVTWTSTITLIAPKIGGATKQVPVSPVVFPATRPVPSTAPQGAPTIISVTPASEPANGHVTIKGTNFLGATGATAVKFGATNAVDYTVVDAWTIVATVPAGAAGVVAVTVTTPQGTSAGFNYTRGA